MYEASKANFYSFDLDKAKASLAAEGVSGVSLEMIPNPGDPDSVTFAEMYQGDLAMVGINLNIVKLDMAAWSDQVNGNRFGAMYVAGSNLALSPGTIFTVSRPIGPVRNNSIRSSTTSCSTRPFSTSCRPITLLVWLTVKCTKSHRICTAAGTSSTPGSSESPRGRLNETQ
jgi:ABC-type transport system substrate-binding protein